ncbi:MAG TPA: FMN-binding negative transcriptional regulator [Sinorhizobium sp.]|nr:FMN-binding negative transcriptional regulator [Sinorhizobium sp.]
MYVPSQFRIAEVAEMLDLMRGNPFAALVSHDAEGIVASHLPTLVQRDGDAISIEAHLARGNPHWRRLAAAPEAEVLMIFSGPDAYIRPGWYPSKAEHGKDVPTWNYAIVHAYGRAEIVDDGAWLLRHVSELSQQQESPYEMPWKTADAPAGYIEKMTRGILGLKVTVTRLEGKAKMGQNRETRDALGAAAGLEARNEGADRAVAAAMRRAHAEQAADGAEGNVR